MPNDRPFRIALSALFVCFTAIRAYYRRASTTGRPGSAGPTIDTRILGILIPFEVITLFGYVFVGRWLAWAAVSIPDSLRWIGGGLGALALALFVWVHRSLGDDLTRALASRSSVTALSPERQTQPTVRRSRRIWRSETTDDIIMTRTPAKGPTRGATLPV